MFGITLGELAADYVPAVVKVLAILAATWAAARLGRRLISSRVDGKLGRQLGYLAPKAIWAVGLIVLLGTVGIDINSLLAMFGVIGLAAALVFTPVGQNLIAGLLAGMDDVVREGDVIDVTGRSGAVTRKGMLSLGVELPNGSMVYVPNTKVIDDELINHDRVTGTRIEVEIKLDGSPDRRRAVEVMEATLEDLTWRLEGKPTAVQFSDIGSNAFHYLCLAWIEHRLDLPKFESMMRTALVDALEDAEISVGETGNLSASDFVVTSANESIDLTATEDGMHDLPQP